MFPRCSPGADAADFVLIELRDNMRTSKWQVINPEDLADIATRVALEAQVYPQALERAEKMWNASATLPIGKFPRSSLAARKLKVVGHFPDLRQAETRRVELEDRSRKAQMKKAGRSKWKEKFRPMTREEKAEERLMKKRQAAIEKSAAQLVVMKTEELIHDVLLAQEQKQKKQEKGTPPVATGDAAPPDPEGTDAADTSDPSDVSDDTEETPPNAVKAWEIVF